MLAKVYLLSCAVLREPPVRGSQHEDPDQAGKLNETLFLLAAAPRPDTRFTLTNPHIGWDSAAATPHGGTVQLLTLTATSSVPRPSSVEILYFHPRRHLSSPKAPRLRIRAPPNN